MIKRIIICFLLLSFIGCEPAEFEIETKHRISVGPNDKTQAVPDIEQSADIVEDPSGKPLLTDVSEDEIVPSSVDDTDAEMIAAIKEKIQEVIGKQWPIYKDTVKWWLCIGVLVLGGCILFLHWLIRLIDHLFFSKSKLGTTFIVLLIVFVCIFLIVAI